VRRFFNESTVNLREGGWRVAVYVDLAHDFAVRADGNNDLGFCLDRAGEIARVRMHVVHHNRLARSRRRTADALRDRDARVRGRLASKRAQHQRLCIAGVEPIKAGPVVMREPLGDGLDDASLQRLQ
jgi:hypothetical protein